VNEGIPHKTGKAPPPGKDYVMWDPRFDAKVQAYMHEMLQQILREHMDSHNKPDAGHGKQPHLIRTLAGQGGGQHEDNR